jgi:hypothetical protein
MHVDVVLGDPVRRREGAGDVAELAALMRADDVVAQVGEQRRAARVERERCARDRGQVFIVDLD